MYTLPILSLLLCTLLACPSLVASADTADDFVESIRNIELFQLKKSSLGCPVVIVGQSCPEENPLYYFKCCGDLNSSCCFRLQDWVMVLLVVLAVCIVISIVVNFIRCLCCY